MYFPLFLPLWGIRKGNKGNFMPKYVREVASGKFSAFKHCSLLYQEVLRNPVLLFLLSERKYSLWYWHQSVLTVPVHLSEQPHWKAGCWCKCDVTTEREHTECCVFFFSLDKKRNAWMGYLYVSLNAQIRNITLLHSSSTSNNNYPQYKAPPPDYAPIHGLSSLLS